jgi:hypothetical protein|tara:strand:+ start:279 stop:515 length:237 start_codon:yes stop_codon:yes gene_type:complete
LNIPKRSSVIPFGYTPSEDNPKLLIEVPKELEALSEIKDFVTQGLLSLREGSAWLEYKTGRKLSHQGLKKIIDERLGS